MRRSVFGEWEVTGSITAEFGREEFGESGEWLMKDRERRKDALLSQFAQSKPIKGKPLVALSEKAA